MQKTYPNPPTRITMYATPYCGDTRRARSVLDQMSVDYDFIDFRHDQAAARLVEQITGGFRSSPTILFPNGVVLVEPSERELRAQVDALVSAGYDLNKAA